MDDTWLRETLGTTIDSIDWTAAAEDVRRFLRPTEESSLKLWSAAFFRARLDQLLAPRPWRSQR